MGDYTRLKIDAVLKSSTPPEVVTILEDIVNGREIAESRLGNHQFFKVEGWRSLLTSRSGVGYFPEADGSAVLDRLEDGRFKISSHSTFKNHDGQMDAFWSWMVPFLDEDSGDVVGEVEVDGYFGKQLAKLVVKSGRIIQIKALTDHDGGMAMGF